MNNWEIVSSKTRVYHALVLIDSMIKYGGNSDIYVLTMDDESYDIISYFTKDYLTVSVFHEKDIIDANIRHLKDTRNYFSYCWTLKPVFCHFIIERIMENDSVTFVDADILFFGNVTDYLSEKKYSVFFTLEEYFPPENKEDEINEEKEINNKKDIVGLYNSGFVSFKKNEDGYAALSWWRNKCLESCDVNNETFGDQKYLNDIPLLFKNVLYEPSIALNSGPWNVLKRKWTRKNNDIFSDEYKVLFYHFSGSKVKKPNTINFLGGIKVMENGFFKNNESSRLVYNIYNDLLTKKIKEISDLFPDFYGYTDQDNNDWYEYILKNNIL